MRWERLNAVGGRAEGALAVARGWLRRVMPRVALLSLALVFVWLVASGAGLTGRAPFGALGPLAFCAVAATAIYYGLKVLVRLKNMLLWRVRRRLLVTYLFVGLTPIVLLLVLGFISAMGGSQQALVRLVNVQMSATQSQARESARGLAGALASLPPNGGERNPQAWLDERAALLRPSLPGARVSVWRGTGGTDGERLAEGRPATLVSAPGGEATRGVGPVGEDAGAPLPRWIQAHEEWSGLAFLPPPDESESAFGAPAVRALARAGSGGRAVAVLVTVPVSRALIQQYRENSGVNVRPFFVGAEGTQVSREGGHVGVSGGGDPDVVISGSERGSRVQDSRGGRSREINFNRDQFGDPLPDAPLIGWYPIFVQSTNWAEGTQSPRWAFMVDWSWQDVGKQFWGDALLGQAWWRVLISVGIFFIVLEALALFSAAWMTRAVTGTVHKLYLATEQVKRGDFSHRIRTRSRDQLGELALAFNEMSADIETLLTERVEHERLEREVEIAAEVQAQLFPSSVPRLAGVEITGECRAARGVAGDYYDYIEIAPGLVAVALGDVSGKGISAALVMSNLQAALRAQATIVAERVRLTGRAAAAPTAHAGAAAALPAAGGGGKVAQPAEVARVAAGDDADSVVAGMTANVNEQLCRSTDANRFATLFLALYDDRTRELRYTNAGHNPALLVRADGTLERLSAGGVMVGAFDWSRFEEAQTRLSEGDLLLIYSDGLTEAQNHLGEEYGEERLAQLAAGHRRQSSDELRRAIFEEVGAWSGAVERGDDQTLVIVKAVKRDE